MCFPYVAIAATHCWPAVSTMVSSSFNVMFALPHKILRTFQFQYLAVFSGLCPPFCAHGEERRQVPYES